MKFLCLCLLKAIVGITAQILERVKSWTVGDFVIVKLSILYSNSEALKEHKSRRISLFSKLSEGINPGRLSLMQNATKQTYNPVCNTSLTQRSSLLTRFPWIAIGRKIKLILSVCLFLIFLKIDFFHTICPNYTFLSVYLFHFLPISHPLRIYSLSLSQ